MKIYYIYLHVISLHNKFLRKKPDQLINLTTLGFVHLFDIVLIQWISKKFNFVSRDITFIYITFFKFYSVIIKSLFTTPAKKSQILKKNIRKYLIRLSILENLC
jgi:hypothetical protein